MSTTSKFNVKSIAIKKKLYRRSSLTNKRYLQTSLLSCYEAKAELNNVVTAPAQPIRADAESTAIDITYSGYASEYLLLDSETNPENVLDKLNEVIAKRRQRSKAGSLSKGSHEQFRKRIKLALQQNSADGSNSTVYFCLKIFELALKTGIRYELLAAEPSFFVQSSTVKLSASFNFLDEDKL